MILSSRILCLSCLLVWPAAGQTNTHIISDFNSALLAKQKQADPYKNVVSVPANADGSAAPKPQPLSEKVVFLTDGKITVILPKGAVIHAPEKNRISASSTVQGRLVEWDEFFMQNRNAIRLESVTIDQLQGSKAISEDAFERIRKANLPTLTAYQGRVVALSTTLRQPVDPSPR
ncbi:MAG: hypothetical protein ACRDBP_01550 [Luteolibacter sp.]